MNIHLFFLVVFLAVFAALCLYALLLRTMNHLLREKIKDAIHKKAEITNFLSLFSQNLRTVEEVGNSMNMTARYVADLVEAQSICIFLRKDDYLMAEGVSGVFPPLHKSTQYVLTKPRYILESLKREKIRIGEGIVGEVASTRESMLLERASDDPRIGGIESVLPIRTLMAVPLVNEGRVTGAMFAVNNRREDRSFSAEQFNNFKFIASQVVLAQNIVEVYSNLSEQQRINQELEFARQLQASLLPTTFPSWSQFDLHAFTRSSKEVSGDFYDFVQIDEDRLLIVIGDACGKGIPACMIMAMTRSFIRSNVDRFTTLKDLLRELNYNLFRDTEDERFITLACCLIDKKESTIEYSRAGHTELYFFNKYHIRKIFPTGSALGLLPNEMSSFDTISFDFAPGMSLLLFTDGLSEATNERYEQYGAQRLEAEFMKSCENNEDPESTIKRIIKSIDNFADSDRPQEDDQTVVIIKHA